MVTVEQDINQSQTNSTTQTQNPQSPVPTELQPNNVNGNNLQTGKPTDLFSNPQDNAIITIKGGSIGSTEAFLAQETAPQPGQNKLVANSLLLLLVVVVIVSGTYFIVKKLSKT